MTKGLTALRGQLCFANRSIRQLSFAARSSAPLCEYQSLYKFECRLPRAQQLLLRIRCRSASKKSYSEPESPEDYVAALQVISRALRKGESMNKEFGRARKTLSELVGRGNPAALYYQGRIFELQKKPRQALKMYEQSVEGFRNAWPEVGGLEHGGGKIWTQISQARHHLGDRKGAREALYRAASDYDDPVACFYLARNFLTVYANDFEYYMLKSAASGNIKAAHEIGRYYVNQLEGNVLRSSNIYGNRKPERRVVLSRFAKSSLLKWAQVWLELAASANNIPSQLLLALLVRVRSPSWSSTGLSKEWLGRARRADVAGEWSNKISWLDRNWDNKQALEKLGFDVKNLHQDWMLSESSALFSHVVILFFQFLKQLQVLQASAPYVKVTMTHLD